MVVNAKMGKECKNGKRMQKMGFSKHGLVENEG